MPLVSKRDGRLADSTRAGGVLYAEKRVEHCGVRPGQMADMTTILVVEDNELLLAVLRRALEREGYQVIPALNGVEMMKVLYRSKPDLIVLDVGLPDVDGRDLLAALKKDPRTFHIPVVVWSGRDPNSNRRIALGLGAEDYVEKGAPSALVPKIERILLRLSERELEQARASIPAKAPVA
jgi:CheY-like chemotaxis protein